MKTIKNRLLKIELPPKRSAFLWGPRRTGKTYWINRRFSDSILIDLLKTDLFADYASHPSLLRERYQGHEGLVVIDEIQMVPDLLNEIHWLIENTGASFLMTGSSARKLRRGHANLLAGRAWRYTMAPLTWAETEGFDLEQIFISGLLPPHFLSSDPIQDLRSYVADYLKEEIAAEAVTQNIPAFAEFLRVAALTSGELLNYTNVGRETGVSAKVVRNYFQILEDTLLGFRVSPWRKVKNRRLIETEKFYLFDVGVANYLARRMPKVGTPEFGHSLEHYILMELKAYQAYQNPELDIRYWRTSTGFEVDFILGDMNVAVEVKGAQRIHSGHVRGLKALLEENPVGRAIIVSLEKEPKKLEPSLEVLPWQVFLEALWSGELV
ncbi:MAG: ATP-binding protein [Deltaproteobacteria bacterium]|nr:ATP-binding protein [Deltaproteobacteria bacterium]MBW2049882.1 ATP-binding protein [Deltaproteobacteria bacterium]MBW2111856.1 ATP-binding protein [Deltaproteobacteria bacterium]MBW2352466.1 ATP-binding protein [Deltaproteobacteria bacterium]HDZ91004.1 ATP-binding protein [Deltaproteobacteria bacterium]